MTFIDNEINQVSGAMLAMDLHDQAPTPFTLASIGSVFLDDSETESVSSTPTRFRSSSYLLRGESLSPMSTSSSLPDVDIVTPQQTPDTSYLPTFSRPPSPDSLWSQSMSSHAFGKPSSSALGGASLYALIGARIWLPAHEMRTMIDGAPCPAKRSAFANSGLKNDCDSMSALEAEIQQFGTEMWVSGRAAPIRRFSGRSASYEDVRVSSPVQAVRELTNGPLAGAAYLHVCAPHSSSDLLQLLSGLEATRSSWVPKIVFVPSPSSCHPGERMAFERAAQRVHVLSCQELFSLYGIVAPELVGGIRQAVENAMEHLLINVGIGADGNGIIVVRCGPHGACIGTRAGGISWTPAYYHQDSLRVRDVTGASNAFIGGFVAGLKITDGNPYDAALYASVSASFAIEQYGLPRLTSSPMQSPVHAAFDFSPAESKLLSPAMQNAIGAHRLRAATGREMWNSDAPQRRLELLRLRAAACG